MHNPRKDGKAIAEPHDYTVQRIVELYGFINNPKKVIPEFQFEIIGAKENHYINQILVEMKENSFSQFPVYDEKTQVLELINTNTISRWLSSEMEKNGTIITENVKVKDLVPFIEFSKNYGYVSRNTSVFEAYELFVNQIIKYKRNLDVLFITHSGKPNEKLLGLITIEDIAHKV